MSVYKKINIVALVFTAAAYVAVKAYWSAHCSNLDCDENLIDGWLRPLLVGSFWTIPIFGLLVLFPGDIFKRWLKYFFWWGFPLSLKLIYDINIHSGGIMSISKSQMAESLGQTFLILTVIFIAVHYLIIWWKKRKGNSVAV